jgi:ABC-2 type transport system permease protein
MNIFLRELKANRKALIIWSVCMFLLVVSGMAKYTAYSAVGSSNDVFNKMPFSIKALLGFGSFDVTTISGFYALCFMYIELTAAIHAVLLGAGIIAKEESDKTTEFLMVKPVSRASVITPKLIAALFNIIVINIVSLISSIVMVATYNKGADLSGKVAMFILSMFLVQLIFLSLGTALAASMRNPKSSGSLATGILLIAFVISKITDLTDKLNVLNLLSPFKYFNINKLYLGNGLNIVIIILSLLLAAIFSVSTYFFYQKRDLHV